MHFPDTDPRWKYSDSLRCSTRAISLSPRLTNLNVDSTVILERPKLKDYRAAIREKLAQTLNLQVDQVSVKFKTAKNWDRWARAAPPKRRPWSLWLPPPVNCDVDAHAGFAGRCGANPALRARMECSPERPLISKMARGFIIPAMFANARTAPRDHTRSARPKRPRYRTPGRAQYSTDCATISSFTLIRAPACGFTATARMFT